MTFLTTVKNDYEKKLILNTCAHTHMLLFIIYKSYVYLVFTHVSIYWKTEYKLLIQ